MATNDNAPTNIELELAYDKFADAESVDVNFIIDRSSQTGTLMQLNDKEQLCLSILQNQEKIALLSFHLQERRCKCY